MPNKYIKSYLNYTGRKYKLLPQILPLFPQNINTFYDLFCGSLDITLNVKANKYIANDKMHQLIDVHKFVKFHTYYELKDYIREMIKLYDLSKFNQDGYLQLRHEYNQNKYPSYLFVLLYYSFNNQIRFNSKGELNMPFGKREFNIKSEQSLKSFKNITQDLNINFLSDDFSYFYNDFQKDDFIYCDPLYLISTATYNERDGWNTHKEKQLLKQLDHYNSAGVKFALSNVLEHKGKTNDILKEWSKKYNVHYLNHSYNNCSSNTRKGDSVEVLITNYA